MMARRKWRWVTRDSDICHEHIVVIAASVKEPTIEDGRFWGATDAEFGVKEFERLFGITIKPGEAVKVQFDAKVVK